jgi:hypothetical protein
MKPLLWLLPATFLLTGCYMQEAADADARQNRQRCRNRIVNMMPGAEVIGYTQSAGSTYASCSATLRFEGKLYAVTAERYDVRVTPLEPVGEVR